VHLGRVFAASSGASQSHTSKCKAVASSRACPEHAGSAYAPRNSRTFEGSVITSYGRRLVIDANFETTVGVVCQAIREEGLQALAQTDVREHFRTRLTRDLRRYVLIDGWSPDLAFETIHLDLEAGPMFPTRFLIYELADGETVVTATEPMAPVADEPVGANPPLPLHGSRIRSASALHTSSTG
jgi:uncharacterized protein (DUF302 family)